MQNTPKPCDTAASGCSTFLQVYATCLLLILFIYCFVIATKYYWFAANMSYLIFFLPLGAAFYGLYKLANTIDIQNYFEKGCNYIYFACIPLIYILFSPLPVSLVYSVNALLKVLVLVLFCLEICKLPLKIYNAVSLPGTTQGLDDVLIEATPMLCLLILASCYYYNILYIPQLFSGVMSHTIFVIFSLALNIYNSKDKNFMGVTLGYLEKFYFKNKNWHKFALAALLKFVLVFTSLVSPEFFLLITIIPLQYFCYFIMMVPLCFTQILVEEYLFRAVFVYIQESLELSILPTLCMGSCFSVLFCLAHLAYFGGANTALLYCLAVFLPTALSWTFISYYSSGVEYSSGLHFANNFTITMLSPLAVTNGGLSIAVTLPIIAAVFLIHIFQEAFTLLPLIMYEDYCNACKPSDDTVDITEAPTSSISFTSILSRVGKIIPPNIIPTFAMTSSFLS